MKKQKVIASILVGSCLSAASACDFKKSPIEILTPTENEVVWTMIDKAKDYLDGFLGSNVTWYCGNPTPDNAYKAVAITWACSDERAISFKVEYATKQDYSDAIFEIVDATENTISIYNLFKGTQYYVRITGLGANGEDLFHSTSTFTTTNQGPRVMKVDGIYNVRDLGGYETETGKTTVQGILYRGGSLRPLDIYDSYLTEEGAQYMSETMNIKMEIDINGGGEAIIPGTTVYGGPNINAYTGAFTHSDAYKEFFALLADKDNYPIYFHCTGGADRTGTLSFLLNAMLGVSEKNCIQDYEFTSFSVYGERNSQTGIYATQYFGPFLTQLKTYKGDTLQEKTENYLLSIGVTQEQIATIKAIMYGETQISV